MTLQQKNGQRTRKTHEKRRLCQRRQERKEQEKEGSGVERRKKEREINDQLLQKKNKKGF